MGRRNRRHSLTFNLRWRSTIGALLLSVLFVLPVGGAAANQCAVLKAYKAMMRDARTGRVLMVSNGDRGLTPRNRHVSCATLCAVNFADAINRARHGNPLGITPSMVNAERRFLRRDGFLVEHDGKEYVAPSTLGPALQATMQRLLQDDSIAVSVRFYSEGGIGFEDLESRRLVDGRTELKAFNYVGIDAVSGDVMQTSHIVNVIEAKRSKDNLVVLVSDPDDSAFRYAYSLSPAYLDSSIESGHTLSLRADIFSGDKTISFPKSTVVVISSIITITLPAEPRRRPTVN